MAAQGGSASSKVSTCERVWLHPAVRSRAAASQSPCSWPAEVTTSKPGAGDILEDLRMGVDGLGCHHSRGDDRQARVRAGRDVPVAPADDGRLKFGSQRAIELVDRPRRQPQVNRAAIVILNVPKAQARITASSSTKAGSNAVISRLADSDQRRDHRLVRRPPPAPG